MPRQSHRTDMSPTPRSASRAGPVSAPPKSVSAQSLGGRTLTFLFTLAIVALVGAIGLYAAGKDGAAGVVLSVCTGVIGVLGGSTKPIGEDPSENGTSE